MINKIWLILLFVVILTGCTKVAPFTTIVSDPPYATGHIVFINEEKQAIAIVEGMTKEEALTFSENFNLDSSTGHTWIYTQKTKIDNTFNLGDKVAIWVNPEWEQEEDLWQIAELIVVLEE